ncbi:HD domain-containing phosphohydrolase [Candidatus Symbiobacter mobilis]|uniref:Response regulator-like protein n=1 Tax=Candidatus Symbiobacter mobilis CR TaxID=946483 RepID=U5NAP5_9BURK|nr:HD domain-containing phosphohydrolase [Candidatus Symbiobacter mobilis]AGX88641.1 response regulator-like protein [Candidatus Symbiobacter mobilis CR]
MSESIPSIKSTILAVDDTPANLNLLASVLNKSYRVQLANSGSKALEIAFKKVPDLIVLDVMMPGMDGYETCRCLKADERTRHVPVLFLTAMTQPEDEALCFEAGGVDFIPKPFHPTTLKARVATHLQIKAWHDAMRDRNAWLQEALESRLQEVDRLRDATFHLMISFAEFRDEDTGHHVKRTQEYVRLLASWLAQQPGSAVLLDDDDIDQIARSAPLHDIGKISIPDSILLKPGPLTQEEFAVMKTHSMQGWEMLRRAAERMGSESGKALGHAMDIARHHHEKWDGSGYPDGLEGTDIPWSARLMAVADVYDALMSRRPYKESFTHEKALILIQEGSGRHFDPAIVQALVAQQNFLAEIFVRWKD